MLMILSDVNITITADKTVTATATTQVRAPSRAFPS